jgi:uncharacterized protein YecE (DUF72 family)
MIYVGTCGFSYDDWRNVIYPVGLKKGEFLHRYSSEFGALELNTTYYRLPDRSFLEKLGDKTPDDFKFFIKVFKGITHEISEATSAQLDQFLDALTPLASGNKLGGILVQFPYSFHCNQQNIDYLQRLLESTGEISTVVEFRNRKWFSEQIFSMLRDVGAGFCTVDEPRLKGLLPPEPIVTSGKLGYVRFHGRNAEKWWHHKEASERYDYLYTDEELTEWRDKILEMAAKAQDTFVMFNNHRGGKAVVNARQMTALLKQD